MKFKHVSIYAAHQTSLRQKSMNNGGEFEEGFRDTQMFQWLLRFKFPNLDFVYYLLDRTKQ